MSSEARPRQGLKIVDLLRPHRRELWLGLLAIAGETAAGLLEPWPLKIVLDNVLQGKGKHGWLDKFIEHAAGTTPRNMLFFACGAVLVIALIDAVCTYSEKYLTTNVGQWVAHDLRRTIYTHVQRLSLAYHDQQPTGDLISRVTVDIDAIQSFIVSGLLGILVDTLTLVGMIAVMFYINWQFAFVALAVIPPLFFIVYTYTRRVKKASREVRKKEGRMISVVQEVVTSIRVVKAFAREDYEVRRFEGESLEAVEAALAARALKAKLVPLVNIVTAIGTCAVLWFGAQMAMSGRLLPGSMVVFVFYLGKMYKPMQDISKTMDSYSKADTGFERIQEILRSNDEIHDERGARRAPRFRAKLISNTSILPIKKTSRFSAMSIFMLSPGTMAALVGPTGAGKTTIINLIARFYDPICWRRQDRRHRYQAVHAEIPSRPNQFRPAGYGAVQRNDLGQHRVWHARMRPKLKLLRPPKQQMPWNLSKSCRINSIRRWASAESLSQAVSVSASRSRARSSATHLS